MNARSNPSSRAADPCPVWFESLEGRRLFAVVLGLEPKALVVFDTANPQAVLSRVAIRRLLPRETMAAIDFEPGTGRLFGLSSTNRLYQIDTSTGITTHAVSSRAQLPSGPTGVDFGFDISPVDDTVRVVRGTATHTTYTGLGTGAATASVRASPVYAAGSGTPGTAPNLVAIAHSLTPGGPGTPGASTVYGIDRQSGSLVRLGSADGVPDSPDAGLVEVVAGIGLPVNAVNVAFDIIGPDNVAFVGFAEQPRSRSRLFGVDLDTGVLTPLGEVGRAQRPLLDFAALPPGSPLLTTDGRTLRVSDSNLPGLTTGGRPGVGGLQAGERIAFLSRRPAGNEVLAYTNQARLYVVDTQSGFLTLRGQSAGFTPVRGETLAGDIDPADDAMRVVTGSGRNFRINLADGSIIDADPADDGVQFDTPLSYAPADPNAGIAPAIHGIAYPAANANATVPTPFGVDVNLDVLTTFSSPGDEPATTANLSDVGSLGVDVRQVVGFDITAADGATNTAFLAYRGRGGYVLTTVDLDTAATTEPLRLARNFRPVAMTTLG